jgi:DNA polymerase-3 subunit epsilon
MRFVVVDLETANPKMTSICQIGIVTFENGVEVGADSRLVNPGDYFDPFNVGIHGIDEAAVRGAPRFPDLHDWLSERLSSQIVACHSHFDRVALFQACQRHALPAMQCEWVDTARVARRTWSQFAKSGYGLANLAGHFGITFKHHDALHDARAAGLVLLRAIEETGIGADEWVMRAATRMPRGDLRRYGDGDGPLVGECLVFTGALQIPRSNAADIAHEAGAAVDANVTKATTMLVVGDQDIEKLNGHDKSGKHRKVEALIASGRRIRVIGEADFMRLSEACL